MGRRRLRCPYRGVTAAGDLWRARIFARGTAHFLGDFEDAAAAARACVRAARAQSPRARPCRAACALPGCPAHMLLVLRARMRAAIGHVHVPECASVTAGTTVRRYTSSARARARAVVSTSARMVRAALTAASGTIRSARSAPLPPMARMHLTVRRPGVRQGRLRALLRRLHARVPPGLPAPAVGRHPVRGLVLPAVRARARRRPRALPALWRGARGRGRARRALMPRAASLAAGGCGCGCGCCGCCCLCRRW